MNRYQFEDLISEYIENELSLSKRKEFETYLEENPEARSLVDSVRYTMDTMRSLPKVKANPNLILNGVTNPYLPRELFLGLHRSMHR